MRILLKYLNMLTTHNIKSEAMSLQWNQLEHQRFAVHVFLSTEVLSRRHKNIPIFHLEGFQVDLQPPNSPICPAGWFLRGQSWQSNCYKMLQIHFDRHPWLLTYVELYKLNKIADPLPAKRAWWENHLPIVMLNESMNMAVGSDSVFASCFISCFCICLLQANSIDLTITRLHCDNPHATWRFQLIQLIQLMHSSHPWKLDISWCFLMLLDISCRNEASWNRPVTGGGGGGGTKSKISSQSSGIRRAGMNFRPVGQPCFHSTSLLLASAWFDKDHVIMSVSAWNFWMYLISDVRSSLKPKSSRIHLQVFMFSMFCLVWILEAVFVVQEEKLPGQFALWSSLGFLDPRKAWNQRNIMTLRGEEAWNTASNCIHDIHVHPMFIESPWPTGQPSYHRTWLFHIRSDDICWIVQTVKIITSLCY